VREKIKEKEDEKIRKGRAELDKEREENHLYHLKKKIWMIFDQSN
jgi:hypothetical protein